MKKTTSPKIAKPSKSPKPAAKPKARKSLAEALQPKPAPEHLPPHLAIVALAGTGKTTTLVEGLRLLRGIPTSITPSPQQQAIWDSLMLSKGACDIAFVAFNSSIAAELKKRLPSSIDSMTCHAMGLRTIKASPIADRLLPGDKMVNFDRSQLLLARVLGAPVWELKRKRGALFSAVNELVGLAKMNLLGIGYDLSEEQMNEALLKLAAKHDIEIDPRDRDEVLQLVPRVMEEAKLLTDGQVDGDDMIWLPLALGLPIKRYDMILVDEAQDLNLAQKELVWRAGSRIVIVGDPNQAIYGFAGADSDSIPSFINRLSATMAGCKVLPLTVTRRCGKAIVEEARSYVSTFEAHENNPTGEIAEAVYPIQRRMNGITGESELIHVPVEQTYIPMVRDGHMIVCRTNAPLVSQCFKFLKMNRRATIQGRKIGQGLQSLLKRLQDKGAYRTVAILRELAEWERKEVEKENNSDIPSESRLQLIVDKAECLRAFCDGSENAGEVYNRINDLFVDEKPGQPSPGIRLSSIHRAKGLEAETVFFLRPDYLPAIKTKQEWERQQERNLQYVAVTRAIRKLVYVV